MAGNYDGTFVVRNPYPIWRSKSAGDMLTRTSPTGGMMFFSRVAIAGAIAVIAVASGACRSKSADESATTPKPDQPSNSGGNAEQALIALENAWPKAVIDRDTATFQRTLAPGFVYTEDSAVIGRGDLISGMATGPDTVVSGGNEDMKVHDFGNNTAVVTGILVLSGKGKDGPFTRRYRYTDTWMFKDGRWQIVAAQDYLIPK